MAEPTPEPEYDDGPQEPGHAVDLTMSLGPAWFDAHRVIYATIILMTAYALYDEGSDPFGIRPLMEMFGMTIAPLFALAMAHAFSDAIDLQIRNGRRLNRHDRRHLVAINLQYLYVAVPPMALIVLLSMFEMDADDIISLVQLIGIGSLGFWGAYAARKARLGAWAQVRFATAYGIMGIIVITVELILRH